MGLLLWIYVAGVIIIFGGCLSSTSHAFIRKPFTGPRSGRRALPFDPSDRPVVPRAE
jgi:uncharacterized BrkB/YihY/UPF0761 family membrane protein